MQTYGREVPEESEPEELQDYEELENYDELQNYEELENFEDLQNFDQLQNFEELQNLDEEGSEDFDDDQYDTCEEDSLETPLENGLKVTCPQELEGVEITVLLPPDDNQEYNEQRDSTNTNGCHTISDSSTTVSQDTNGVNVHTTCHPVVPKVLPKVVSPKASPKVRVVSPKMTPKVKVVSPKMAPKVASPKATSPKMVSPKMVSPKAASPKVNPQDTNGCHTISDNKAATKENVPKAKIVPPKNGVAVVSNGVAVPNGVVKAMPSRNGANRDSVFGRMFAKFQEGPIENTVEKRVSIKVLSNHHPPLKNGIDCHEEVD